jgi:hypothetical protein
VEFIMSIAAVSAASHIGAQLFAASSAPSAHGKQSLAAIDDCGTVVPHKIPGWPPPPPALSNLAHFAGVSLQTPTRSDDGWCGTVPHKFPSFPPPPPPPWVDGINQMLGNR